MTGLGDRLLQYGAHTEQVTALPDGARVLVTSDACANAGFAMGDHVYTTQNHPEMSDDFIAALVAEYAPKLPADVAQTAKASLGRRADTLAYAHTIAQFFEQASAD